MPEHPVPGLTIIMKILPEFVAQILLRDERMAGYYTPMLTHSHRKFSTYLQYNDQRGAPHRFIGSETTLAEVVRLGEELRGIHTRH